ncbi:hypothetical protein N7449_009918 [Penicillium cf. viridicatum]|uniref:Uncharacterized protein n=1 Tax=Penicillium cf. viridicatum TaxID=2972119 RepID=A0A9W9M337_9EURO|nr:hypothetical protein N7449_009918 [Penicillium cf. viridicatum]
MAVRSSSQVQHIQESSPWVDIYTDSPTSPLRMRSVTQHISLVTPHAHPEPKRWQDPGGWGARHMNDKAPFTLWDEINRQYRAPMRNEFEWIHQKFGNGKFLQSGWFICIETDNPPKPVPLTLGCMPVNFVRTGETFLSHSLKRLIPTHDCRTLALTYAGRQWNFPQMRIVLPFSKHLNRLPMYVQLCICLHGLLWSSNVEMDVSTNPNHSRESSLDVQRSIIIHNPDSTRPREILPGPDNLIRVNT